LCRRDLGASARRTPVAIAGTSTEAMAIDTTPSGSS
jgi:hypothetical protein